MLAGHSPILTDRTNLTCHDRSWFYLCSKEVKGFAPLVPGCMLESYCFHSASYVCLLLTRTIVLVTKLLFGV